MKELIHQDKELLLYLNGLGDTAYDPFWLLITGKWFWIPLYVIFLYLILKKYPIKSVGYILLFIALGIGVSDQLAGVFKHGFLRLRPCHNPELMHKMRLVTCGGQYGFYSSHASNSFFLATFLSFLLKKYFPYFPYIIFTWAALVSYSRIYLGVHFPGDILVGTMAGMLIGFLFSYLMGIVLRKNKINNEI
ncbi:MAG: phosphatase PAP2 family protein [Bacteroidetes bacterium]|nr:phosphatase PAP2 family protein [Bacteroidota bacterium]